MSNSEGRWWTSNNLLDDIGLHWRDTKLPKKTAAPIKSQKLASFFTDQIFYPDNVSEFEIQAAIYRRLRQADIDVRGEVYAKGVRFDLVVFCSDKQASIIIEVKRRDAAISVRQQASYMKFGLPVIFCIGTEGIEPTINKIIEMMNNKKI